MFFSFYLCEGVGVICDFVWLSIPSPPPGHSYVRGAYLSVQRLILRALCIAKGSLILGKEGPLIISLFRGEG
jgi:hypothetical protein